MCAKTGTLPAAFRLAVGCLSLLLAVAGCFPHRAGPRLAHFEHLAPAPGGIAPDFTLESLDGQAVTLSALTALRPVVLLLGSESCPVFRHRRHWLGPLVRDYGDRVDFLAVYTLEAHPVGASSPYTEDEWDLWINRLSGVRPTQPARLAERAEQARSAQARLSLPMPILVDRMDDAVWRAYGAASSPAFVIDRGGRVVARQPWSDPGGLRAVLRELVARPAR